MPRPSLLARLLLGVAVLPAPALQAQAAASPSSAAQPASPAPAQAAPTVTSLVQPASTELAQILPTLHPDKWKLSSDLRRRNGENLSSIASDLSATLPNLLSAADAAPGQLQPLLAVSRNLHALYDVVLRVVATAEIAAPEQQTAGITHALTSLSSARQSLDQQLDTSATAQQQQLTSLQTSLAAANTSLAQAKTALQEAQGKSQAAAAAKPRAKVHHKPATPPANSPAPPQ